MALAAGTRFEHYEVESVIGVGGMGEVYRACDRKLERPVALKVLRAGLANDPDRLARFHREARLLASLNHPNIAQIYGVATASNDIQCIVMELVGGETLQARLRRGPLPVDEALPIARQIAAAIEAAHERGIVHRDLKPGNVMIDGDGRVKVLDFGLGKALDPVGAADDLTHSPTILSDRFTQANVLIGTAAYMSPEQARGKVADERSDIWAFGCVLYEMLTGRPPFGGGDTVTDLLSDILRVEPDWTALPAQTPQGLQLILRRCLQKDRRQRYHAIGDLRHDLETAAQPIAVMPQPITVAPRRAAFVERAAWIAALCAIATAGVVIGARHFSPPAVAPIASRFLIDLPEGAVMGPSPAEPVPSVSPDGQFVVFRMGGGSSPPVLYLRPIGALTAQPIAGTEGVFAYPFWSADSRYIGFFADGKLKKVAAAGGPPQVLTDGAGPGATWNQDDVILFADQGSIRRVSAAGGTSTAVRTPDKSRNDLAYVWPSFLPDGRHFVYVASNVEPGRNEVRVAALDGGADTSLFPVSSRVLYAHPNHLLFVRDGTLMAQPFDTGGLALTGEAFPIAESIGATPLGGAFGGSAAFGVATNGTLVYRVSTVAAATELTWFDRSGNKVGILPSNGVFTRPVFSPDQSRVVGERERGNAGDIWILDVKRGTSSRFTFDPADDISPVFSPDGAQVAFASNREGTWGLYVKPATGVGAEKLLHQVPGASQLVAADWSPDGRLLFYSPLTGDSREDVWVLPLAEDGKPYPVLNQKYNERRPRFSPDGRWMLYSSNETGREEIYVQAFPPSGGKWQVSVNGASVGYWRKDGRELVFDSLDRKIMAVDVKLGATFEAGIPHELFDVPNGVVGLRFAMTADGQRFLAPLPSKSDERVTLRAVLNWPAAVRK